MSEMSRNYLLEIGTEELPTDSLDLIEGAFGSALQEKLRGARVRFSRLSLYTTPRRVAVFIEGLAPKQDSEIVEWVGPSWERAFDAAGKPTEALAGFLRAKNLKETDITKKETPRGNYAVARRTVPGKRLEQVLPELVSAALRELAFPKTMRWDRHRTSFPRPIRWILSLLDRNVLAFSVGDVKAGRVTYGHRFMAPAKRSVPKADLKAYRAVLKKAHVLLDLAERKALIQKQFAAKTRSVPDAELVHVTAQLTEEPFVVTGAFSADFLSLPQEILATTLKKNQKIFTVGDARGKLKPQFAAVMNGKRENLPRIIKDYRDVLEARLRDARFFYQEDTRERLEQKVDRLKDIVFLGKLGNMREKVERMVHLAGAFSQAAGLAPQDAEDLRRAAFLSKADLLTQMVYEFPELQGVMGREYARASGEREPVAAAVAEHYLPRNLQQSYQSLFKEQSRLGSLLAILEKIDTLVGAFGIGLEPTGSQDPYALRRAGGGIVKIIRAFKHRFDLLDLIRESVRLYGGRLAKDETAVTRGLEAFFKERIAHELGVPAGSVEDPILKAVLKTSWSEIGGVIFRFEVLKHVHDKDPGSFEKARKVVERTHNILKAAGKSAEAVRQELLIEPSERHLYELIGEKSADLRHLADEEKFDTLTQLYGKLFYDPLHEFFDKVLVNVEDATVRENRRALMRAVNRLYVDRVADLALVPQAN
ncbi:MAG: glycine--tRNA ligase subunit beta [Candidatus Omnitrophica bacterium]|nr:glycine--tRNA ligase subunit beta [Candidatus Omnitrophota bacterium]